MERTTHIIEEVPKDILQHYTIHATTPFEKIAASGINAVFAFGLATPFLMLWGPTLAWKWSVIGLFALYEIFVFFVFKDRCFGMHVMGTYYMRRFKKREHVLYNILYTLSFSTCLVHIFFPFDLLLFNILFVQLPFVLITGTTLHGYISNIETVKLVRKKDTETVPEL
ncbi:MAG: hypothetical protein RI911_607 [Candidatus Parcubacteria bacterium]|jgi:hypothetical protein